jgi:hypothetical protein
MRGVNMKEDENKKDSSETKRLNIILLAILIVNILDFITRLIKG